MDILVGSVTLYNNGISIAVYETGACHASPSCLSCFFLKLHISIVNQILIGHLNVANEMMIDADKDTKMFIISTNCIHIYMYVVISI